MDDEQSRWGRFLNLMAVPVGLLALVPLALLFVLWFYVAALSAGVRLLLRAPFARTSRAAPASALPGPHFSEPRSGVPANDRRG